MPRNDEILMLENAIHEIEVMSSLATDGQWLENQTVDLGEILRDWDLEQCVRWKDWDGANKRQDIGIDAVGLRRDGSHVAIQCKSRKLDELGHGSPITKGELDKVLSITQDKSMWSEVWVVTNGDNPLTDNAATAKEMLVNRVKTINIGRDVQEELQARKQQETRDQSKSRMQDEAVARCVDTLVQHYQSDSGGTPKREARGRLILPCGAGKTRVSLRIVEKLTEPGGLSIVLCPSIALVAQIRREYLQFTQVKINALAVCSDETAGISPKQEGKTKANDPTLDTSFVSADEIKGQVTTDPIEIATWIDVHTDVHDGSLNVINVIFGTYQSGAKIAEGLNHAGASVDVLIADEAHRTAGIRKKRNEKLNERIRDFTLCHRQDAFPAKYRVYQTATPRIYSNERTRRVGSGWMVRTMDDETVFGVELYRRSYVDAVKNGWLSDYRIVAIGVNDANAFDQANRLASMSRGESVESLKTAHYLRGLAFSLALSGATRQTNDATSSIEIGSCIAFMNTVEKSRNLAKNLQTSEVHEWIGAWFKSNNIDVPPARYVLQHLDAQSNVTSRHEALRRLGRGTPNNPLGILNVGIFGEGTDTPALNAVAFLEPRRSPIDVIQAVGRAMRTSPGKNVGYIICPILIPPNVDAEQWLSTSQMDEGWQELGEILLALRAHDGRIETELEHLLQIYAPSEPERTRNFVGIASGNTIRYYETEGPLVDVYRKVESVTLGETTHKQANFVPVSSRDDHVWTVPEPGMIITGKKIDDGSTDVRETTIVRTKAKSKGDDQGSVDIDRCKQRAKELINKPREGRPVATGRKTQPAATRESPGLRLLRLADAIDNFQAIKLNLLEQSGLKRNRVERDLNILEDAIKMASTHLVEDGLEPVLSNHFNLTKLNVGQNRASGATVATLILMNAAMIHQRIDSAGGFLELRGLSEAKKSTNVIRHMRRDWDTILRQDYEAVFEPAVDILNVIEDETSRRSGLERALHHIASEAERIAETYADMGMDHAGPLFNRVMGDQKSDGAFFTRPLAALIAANLTLDLCDHIDWTDERSWRNNKIVDLACGSGTLLAAMLTEMRRRASNRGLDQRTVSRLHRAGVEDAVKGFDINPVSLQLAASQLTIGNREVRFKRMGLHRMPYGPKKSQLDVNAGSLELLAQRDVVGRPADWIDDPEIDSVKIWKEKESPAQIENAVDAARNARIVIMNPPFTNRSSMGEKFSKEVQKALRNRVDSLEELLVKADPEMARFTDKNSIRPLFVALADHCLRDADGVLSMVIPTAALCATSGDNERCLLAKRFHIHTVLTCHLPGQINLSEGTNINESIVIARRLTGNKPDTRFVHLDKFPMDEQEAEDLCGRLRCTERSGDLGNGWGVISQWQADRIAEGDWSPANWRDPVLASAAYDFSNHPDLIPLCSIPDVKVHATGRELRGGFENSHSSASGSFPIIKSKGADSQMRLRSTPDEVWRAKNPSRYRDEVLRLAEEKKEKLRQKAGHLLITAGQRLSTGRLTSISDNRKFVGNGWMPVTGLRIKEAKALNLFLNSTVGRLLLMRSRGKTLDFPTYSAAENEKLMVPDVRNNREVRDVLFNCYNETRMEIVSQYRDGETLVRQQWDCAVELAMGWPKDFLSDYRDLLHLEPCVRGLGYTQFADEPNDAVDSVNLEKSQKK